MCVRPGVTGNVSINENGDRNGDYSLLDMNPETGVFEVITPLPSTYICVRGNLPLRTCV
jgi:hypothetical protein